MKLDPTVATGPLATIISDITTLVIYLGVDMLLLDKYNFLLLFFREINFKLKALLLKFSLKYLKSFKLI